MLSWRLFWRGKSIIIFFRHIYPQVKAARQCILACWLIFPWWLQSSILFIVYSFLIAKLPLWLRHHKKYFYFEIISNFQSQTIWNCGFIFLWPVLVYFDTGHYICNWLPCSVTERYLSSRCDPTNSGLFVIVSWLSLFLPPESIPGRTGMAMTTLLTLAAMFGAVRQNTPKVSYVSALGTE